MRFARILSSALAFGASVSLLAALPGAAQVKVPVDFTFERGKESPGPVTFSHGKHRAAGVEKCQACHTKVFKMKRGASGPITMARLKAGELCGTCHNGKTTVKDTTVFDARDEQACRNCHKK